MCSMDTPRLFCVIYNKSKPAVAASMQWSMLQVWHLLPALIHCTSTLHLYLTPAGDCVCGGEQEFKRSGRDSGNLRSLVTTYII